MKRFIRYATFLTLSAFSFLGNATLIGDTLSVERSYPNIGTPYNSAGIKYFDVVDGDSDLTPFSAWWSIDADAANIAIQVNNTYSRMGGSDTVFDGLLFKNFDFEITNAFLISETGGLFYDVEFGRDFIAVNMSGALVQGQSMNIGIEFGDGVSVDEPASLAIFSLMLALLYRVRKGKTGQL